MAKFQNFLGELGFEVSGNSSGGTAYGTYDGFEVNASLSMNNVAPVVLHFSFYADDAQKDEIVARIKRLNLKGQAFCDATGYGLVLGLRDTWAIGRILGRLGTVLPQVTEILKNNGALGVGYCPVCGTQSENRRIFDIDGMSISLDPDCALKINAQIENENEEFKNAPGNYGRGFLGALVGALGGAAVAAILFYIGYVSSLSAFLAVILGAALYAKFGGKRDKVMVIIVAATSVITMLATVFGYYLVMAGMGAAEAGVDISALEAFSLLMQDADWARAFWSDFVMMLLFSAIGVVFQAIALSKSVKRPTGIN